MTTRELLEKYLKYYTDRGHKQIPNVSLIPEGDSTLLFVNSGMFPLVPYLSGEKHPLGNRLLNVQRSLRFEDIDDVGDNRHTIAFHMIGNWSLGDYFKKEQIPWVYEFLINDLKLDPNRLFATVFEGDKFAPKDEESIGHIKAVFKKYKIDAKEGERIFPCGRKSNWWQRGEAVGELGGPDSEIFYYLPNDNNWKGKSPETHDNEFLEIGNSVFMQYRRTTNGWEELPQKNVDFGGGLERIALVVQGKEDIFETDSFWPIIKKVEEITKSDYYSASDTQKYMRILADHMRAACLLIMDGVTPSNKDQGYILRRLLRKMFRTGKHLGVSANLVWQLVPEVTTVLGWLYPQLRENEEHTITLIKAEEEKFSRVLKSGEKEAERVINKKIMSWEEKDNVNEIAKIAFDLFQSIGYPLELFYEDLKDNGIEISYLKLQKEFERIYEEHQSQSRSGAEGKFKGGLADHSDTVVKYHTTTHLLQRALKNTLGDHVRQLGSNITNERLRFDFPNPGKLTEEELHKVEEIVNSFVADSIPVNYTFMPKAEAEKSGALFIKGESYPDEVKVYYIGESLENAVSKEFCGGPHVSSTAELLPIEIYKQEIIGDGKVRVYARFK
ncbi:alanine--tRNA ligase [candidate division WWE3 bacterium]|uniref:alanine--tRNA ligase n=1 Tax=candidate division WWE3 bacterium TaxID=2053526 RepID=A0A7X9DL05_UNCKA|nr:alanine--tRNA ligase [candidate division WWE3 bacterium]